MFIPKKVKHRKWHKIAGTSGRLASRLREINFGSFGLKAMTGAWVTSRQLEAARRVVVRYLRKGGKMWVRVFPDKPVTMKGSEVPMGKGKGTVDHYVVDVKPGSIMIELDGVTDQEAHDALKMAGDKLPLRTRVIKK